MKKLTQLQKQAKARISDYNRSSDYNLHDVYKTSYSYKKEQAFDYCKELCNEYNGRDLRIISYNTFIFTAGFIYNDKIEGVIKFMFITPSNNISVYY